jgi:hypothetical protein
MESTTSSTSETPDRLGRPVWSMSDTELTDALTSAHRLEAQAAAWKLRLIREVDARNLGVTAGAASTGQWVAGKLTIPPNQAGGLVKLARHVDRDLPATSEAFAHGDISLAHVRVISDAMHRLPSDIATRDLKAQVDATLAEQATTFDPPTLRRLGHHVLDTIDPDLADRVLEKQLRDEESRAQKDRFLRLTLDKDTGTWRLVARLPGDVGEKLKTVLDPLSAPQTGPAGWDNRTPEQRMVDAVDDLLDRVLGNQLTPSHGGNPTQLVITLTRTGVGTTLPSGIQLSPDVIERQTPHRGPATPLHPQTPPTAGAPRWRLRLPNL